MNGKLYVALALAAWLFAQTTGTITGTVHDISGAVIPGATITASHSRTTQIRSVTPDSAGRYVVPLLPLGEYRVRVEKEGFAPFVQQGITLQANSKGAVAEPSFAPLLLPEGGGHSDDAAGTTFGVIRSERVRASFRLPCGLCFGGLHHQGRRL